MMMMIMMNNSIHHYDIDDNAWFILHMLLLFVCL